MERVVAERAEAEGRGPRVELVEAVGSGDQVEGLLAAAVEALE